MSRSNLLELRPEGLFCARAGFYVDPWRPVDRAVVTHGHTDHACPGCGSYLTAAEGQPVLRCRLGDAVRIESLPYAQTVAHNGVRMSLHPAGHILGSSQVALESGGEIWVFSGDYKLQPDPTCTGFEPVRCHTLITESTFGLPIYRWPTTASVMDDIHQWWRANQDRGKASLLLGYALGKAQRLLVGLDPSIGPIFTHGAVERLNRVYRQSGVSLPATGYVSDAPADTDWSQALIVAPPSAHGTPWTRRFGTLSTAMASGWMRIRGTRRRRAVDRGFVLSDHADWSGLLQAIRQSEAERILVTHGYAAILARWLREQGYDAQPISTHFEGEVDEEAGEPFAADVISSAPRESPQ